MAKCEACGESIGFSLLRYNVPDMNGKQHPVCKNCVQKAEREGKRLNYDSRLGKVIIGTNEESEIRKKCNNCGHIMCYNALDLFMNQQNLKNARINAMAGVANALNGQYAASAVNTANANSSANQIVDYTKCPKCGSVNLVELSNDEYESLNRNHGGQNTISPADELKKFKELLDSGVITQEEFDAKKKQLLGL